MSTKQTIITIIAAIGGAALATAALFLLVGSDAATVDREHMTQPPAPAVTPERQAPNYTDEDLQDIAFMSFSSSDRALHCDSLVLYGEEFMAGLWEDNRVPGDVMTGDEYVAMLERNC